jgi:hypothetical protein
MEKSLDFVLGALFEKLPQFPRRPNLDIPDHEKVQKSL